MELAQSYLALGQVDRARTLLQAQLPAIDRAREHYRDLAADLQAALATRAKR